MGKALVVNGLSVSKPLMRVHLYMTQADIILADYLRGNTSINDVEKNALKTFVNTLYEANLWGKMKYFYPIIGENVSDALLNVIDPSGDDIFKNADVTNLTISNRTLIVNTTSSYKGNTIVGDRAKSLDINNISFISAFTANINNTGMYVAMMGTQVGGGSIGINELASNAVLYSYIKDGYGTYSFKTPSTSDVSRIACGTTSDSKAHLFYKEDTPVESDVFTSPAATIISKGNKVLEYVSSVEGGNPLNFFAIGDGLTHSEWLLFYSALKTYLLALNRIVE